jgi:anthranilate synthase component 1
MKIEQKVEILGKNFDVFSLFKHLTEKLDTKYSFLLESIGDKNRPLYSFICFEPDYILNIKNESVKVENLKTERGEMILQQLKRNEDETTAEAAFDDRVEYKIKALDAISEYFPKEIVPKPKIFPRHVFYGGYLGYLGYDIVAPWVGFESKAKIPDVMLGMHTTVLIYDHLEAKLLMVDNAINGKHEDFGEIKRILQSYRRPVKRKLKDVDFSLNEFKSNTTEEEFSDIVKKSKDYVFAGDILQVVVSRRVDYRTDAEDLEIYHVLRDLNPSPYMYYLNFGSLRFVGSSPEALVTVDNRTITTVPIAGTRRRGRSREDEKNMEKELISDPKERAEHVMLVDLARNDLAKVSKPGTVKTSDFMTVKKYGHVMHLVTTVRGTFRDELSTFDVMKGVFPAGTVTGAPKLRAMEIIQELEKENRGSYAGSIGYFALNGDLDWAITIRTVQLLGDEASVQAGAGIVADSQPHLEWIETCNKMRSLLKAIKIAEAI